MWSSFQYYPLEGVVLLIAPISGVATLILWALFQDLSALINS
jgi:hypothetical protein